MYVTDLASWCRISFGSYAFSRSHNLYLNDQEITDLVIPSGITSISPNAFYLCTGLTSVVIPEGVTSIGSYAFNGCSSLGSIVIPNSVTHIGYNALSGTSWYNIQPDGLVYAGNVAYRYKGTMPANTAIDIREGTLGVADYAFSNCSGLQSVTIPWGVTNIGSYAFNDCYRLPSVTIPSTVTAIDNYAFSYCRNLTTVTMDMKKPLNIDKNTFSNRSNTTLYVPYGSKTSYEAADYWKEFKEIVEIDIKDEDNYIMPTALIACKGGQATLPISMNNVEQIVGFQFDLQLPEGVTLATNANGTMAATLTDRASDHSLTVSKVGDGLYRFISVSMNNNAFAGNEGALLNVKLLVDESVAEGDYEVTVTNTELTASDQTEIHSVDGTATLTVRKAEPGDVNGDGKLSVSDVASIIGYVLNDRPAIFIESAADLNGSNTISVTDAVIVIDKILNANTPAGARRTEEPENEPQ